MALKNVVKFIRDLNLENEVRIIIPEIVWMEIKQQRKEKYYEIYNKIKEISEEYILPTVNIQLKNIDYDEYFNEMVDGVLKEYIEKKKIGYDMPIVIDKDSIVKRA
ncbi:DUF4935 domain-containing protein [Clostridium gasigenes]|uniref:PIN domain-containing protein n=1 Tax=Clostridium gasigenes TaxID=94869 RepID=UPI001C0AC06C|nr:PIN domain-containing protein [Clostridium gasigenes]MBU3089829.1 DUF4935 domain-containing protein [Clostridium gasigenes]